MISKHLENCKIHFGSAEASYMKALLTAEIAAHADPAEKAMIQGMYDELKSNVVTLFGQPIWDGL